MASRTYQPFLIGIICIALILTSGSTIVKARENFGTLAECSDDTVCNELCAVAKFPKGGVCFEGSCLCKK
ncbi:putative knottin, scorpion toxin [Lupinus albus]|uniref:Putative knottin, scorpion toxin n=1 Tax=Lupinus albus TaxID=3870 RepID=A0A6A4QUJ1_LUPAL|nr:putative knottin, scorpion toxin [Lupinus albus]